MIKVPENKKTEDHLLALDTEDQGHFNNTSFEFAA